VRFLSRNSPETTEVGPAAETHAGGKGRPTPTRKEAEAQRKQTLKVPTDPKAARKAAKARAADERQAGRAALLAGDERGLPPRDAGPVRKFVRDYVDGRWASAELFLPVALAVLVIGLLPVSTLHSIASMLWMLITLFILVDTTMLVLRLKRVLKERWPDPADRKGTTLYAVMRLLQIRRLRLPPPQVRPGGRPVKRKAPKEPRTTAK
jgi:Protein of unknown function (DUF3043)